MIPMVRSGNALLENLQAYNYAKKVRTWVDHVRAFRRLSAHDRLSRVIGKWITYLESYYYYSYDLYIFHIIIDYTIYIIIGLVR